MKINSVNFISSSPDYRKCPPPNYPEFAFIGRSNVGKSSIINLLTGSKSTAKVSSTPGKTQLINHFLINNGWYLTDLPGYGFARLSRIERFRLESIIYGYFLHRENLKGIFLLIDSRHEPQKIDLEFMNWLFKNKLNPIILFTKIDKISKADLATNLVNYQTTLHSTFGINPDIILTSTMDKIGYNEILNLIEESL